MNDVGFAYRNLITIALGSEIVLENITSRDSSFLLASWLWPWGLSASFPSSH